jgi:hypothetical protein
MFVVLFAGIFLYTFLGSGINPQNAQEQQSKESIFKKYENPDDLTRVIRDTSKNFVVVKTNSEAERETVYKNNEIVEDYGSFVLTAKSKSQKPTASDLESQTLNTTINLPGGKFEPITDQPSLKVGTDLQKEDTTGKKYYIVQFGGIAKDEWLESLREVGAEIVQYIPHQAFIVYGDGEAIGKIANHSKVRWVGQYGAQNKISPDLKDFTTRAKNETAMFDLAVYARADLAEVSTEFADTVRGQIRNQIKLPKNFFNILRVEIPTSELSKIAEIPDVFRVDLYTKPINEDERSAQIVAGNFTGATSLSPPGYNPLAQFGADGTNVTVAVVDDGITIPESGGFYLTSNNTVDGPLRGADPGATGGHGHLNASIIAGDTPFSTLDPLGYNYGIGVAPKANIINIPRNKTGYTGTDAQVVDDTLNTAGPNGVKGYISNNSWGDRTNGNSYDSFAAMYDGFVQDGSLASSFDPITLIFSAGNCGNAPPSLACSGQTGLTRPKVAKNIIAVGVSENVRPEIGGTIADNMDDLHAPSSRGPAADGRIKPDVTAPGTVITGSQAENCCAGLDGGKIGSQHVYSTGSSHSAPHVAGAAALFTNFWKNTHGGTNPSPALIKAAIINSAQDMNGANTFGAVPNGSEGWGRVNVQNMLRTGVSMKYVDQETTFTGAGEQELILGTVADSTKPVRVSLVWTDPPAAADPALVNNLDLTVKIGDITYKGNVFSGGRTVTGGSPDTVNNVENIFLPPGIPAGTPFTIQVTSTAVNADGKVGNADGTDQHFALVGYNYSPCIYSISSTTLTVGTSGGDINVDVSTPGYCTWTAESDLSWATITSGQITNGNGTVRISVQPNSAGSRSGVVRIAGKDFTIVQQGSTTTCSYALSSTGVNVNNAASSGSFSVTTQSGCGWNATSNAPWISITSGNSGNGGGTVAFTVQANSSGAARTGTITAGGQTFTVNQTANCSYSLSTNSANYNAVGGSGTVNVTTATGCAWTAASNVSWITITAGNNGTGSGTVSFTVAANNGSPRTGTLTVAGQTFTVSQSSACTITLPSETLPIFLATGGSGTFAVTAPNGCAWTATTTASWITINSGAGTGNGAVSFTVSANGAGFLRTAAINVNGQSFTVTQGDSPSISRRTPFDFDGDRKSDLSIFRPSAGEWWYLKSSHVGNSAFQFGTSSDKLVPADFTGDGKTDIAFFRPSSGEWFVLRSEDSSFFSFPFGASGDIPAPADYDGDGKADPAVFRPSTTTWFVSLSTGGTIIQRFGQPGDIPVVADYDGDNKADIAIYRPSVGQWWLSRSTAGVIAFQFGASTDKPVQGDYTGDGKADVAFFKPSSGEWFILRSEDSSYYAAPFGTAGDIASPGDYDGDGKSDFAVFRPSSNTWFVQRSTAGTLIQPFGQTGDKPVPSAFIP